MKIVVAPNAFKHSLSPGEAARAIARGLRRADPNAEIISAPIADGGDGSAEALIEATGGTIIKIEATDPLGRPVFAEVGMLGGKTEAVIEIASSIGLRLLKDDELNPLIADSRGAGEQLVQAIRIGATSVIIGLGGSATIDGGIGFARALGFEFFDSDGNPIPAGGGSLIRLAKIVAPKQNLIGRTEIIGAADVVNPLIGPEGAARVYGPQKGAGPTEVDLLEKGLLNLADRISADLGVDVAQIAGAGAGAAGGLGAAIVPFAGGRLEPGADLIIERIGLEPKIAEADFVITGEGRFDASTGFGKGPARIIELAKKHDRPVFVLAGSVGGEMAPFYKKGLTAAFPILDGPADLQDSIDRAQTLLADAAERLLRTINR